MNSIELRLEALKLATYNFSDPEKVVTTAEKFLNFLEGTAREAAKAGLAAHDTAAAAAAAQLAAAKKEVEVAAKKKRGRPMQQDPTPKQPPIDNEHVAPGCEQFTGGVGLASANAKTVAASMPITATGETSSVGLTLDDVRAALVSLQTRKNREASLEILAKYTAPAAATTGNVKAEAYGKLIAELNAA